MTPRIQPPESDEPVEDVLENKISFQAVIIKIKGIAANHYDNKITENILPIFNHLNKDEKKLFLKSLANILFIVESNIMFDKQELESIRTGIETNKQALGDEVRTIDKLNEIELIKLKTWSVKASAAFLIVAMLAIAGIWSLFGGEHLSNFALMVKIKKIFFEIIGL